MKDKISEKWYIVILSFTMGILTTITSLLLFNFERIQQWRKLQGTLTNPYNRENIYKTILLSPEAFIIMFLSTLTFGIIIAVLDEILNKNKEKEN